MQSNLKPPLPHGWKPIIGRSQEPNVPFWVQNFLYIGWATHQKAKIGCFYHFDGEYWVGSPGVKRPLPNPFYELTWPVYPERLLEMYRFHNGFERFEGGRPILLPASQAAPLTAFMRFGEEDILYEPAKYLAFAKVSGGLLVMNLNDEIFYWSQQTHKIQRYDGFWWAQKNPA